MTIALDEKFAHSRWANFGTSFAFITGCLLLLLLCGYFLEMLMPVDPLHGDPNVAAKLIYPAEALHPKPHDRLLFPLISIAGFITICVCVANWRAILAVPISKSATFWVLFLIVVPGSLYLGFNKHLEVSSLAAKTAVASTALCAFIVSIRNRTFRPYLIACVIVFTSVASSSYQLFDSHVIAYSPNFTSHYEAAIFSIVHIAAGGTCLADTLTQYGCYGEFLAPLVRLIGASTLTITSLMVALQLACVLSIVKFSAALIRSTTLIIASSIVIAMLLNLFPLPYFQYNPIRLLFPATSLLMVLFVQSKPDPLRNFLAGVFAGAGLTWNLDTGIAVFGSLLAFAAAGAFTSNEWKSSDRISRALGRSASFLAGSVLFVSTFLLYLELKSGWTVDFFAAFEYQSAFYIAGVAMLPMPGFPSEWSVVAAIVSVTLLAAISRVAYENDPLWERAGYLAILSIGLLLYYTGRSHWSVLRFVIWPEVILFAFITDQYARTAPLVGKLIASMLVIAPIVAITNNYQIWKTGLVASRSLPNADWLQEDIAFVASHTNPGEKVAIIAENQSTLYGETKTWPMLAGPSLAEFIRVADKDLVRDSVSSLMPDKIFTNKGTLTLGFDPAFLNLGSNYDLAETGPGGRMLYYKRRH